MVKEFLFIGVLCLDLIACAEVKSKSAAPPLPVIQEVEIPVPAKIPIPPVSAFVKPVLPISQLTPLSTEDDVFKAYVLSIKILENWSLSLESYLQVYQSPPSP